MGRFVLVLLASIVVSALAMTITALVAKRVGRVSVVDVTWGLALVAVALVCAVLGDGTAWRRWLLLLLVGGWGGRLAWHIWSRSRGKGDDPRYAALLGDGGFAAAVRKVFVVQGAAVVLVGLPLVVSSVTTARWWPLAVLGVLVWSVGLFFEAVGDAQLEAYKRMDDRPKVMDLGLWRYTRHPNYFGDACVWWGIWLIALASDPVWPALLTVVAPVTMTYFLAYATGAKPLERTMMKREGYPEYAARTSMLLPLPPRKA